MCFCSYFLLLLVFFAVCFVCNIFAWLVCCVAFARVAVFSLISLSLLAFAFAFVIYLSFAKPLLVLATDFSVWLMLFYVLIICLHFVVLLCCDGFARAVLFCVVFLLSLAPLLVTCVVVGLRRVLCVL